MSDKHYSDDWAKEKSRQLVKSVIERTILKKKRPEEIKVLFFPGIDAREVFEVYDLLGIPRNNMIGLERERDIADAIDRKNLGIQIIRNEKGKPLSLEEHFTREKQLDYDVVSLDFIGPLSTAQIDTLKTLKEKQQPQNFVFHCANLLRRDGATASHYVAGSAAASIKDSYDMLSKSAHAEIANKLGALISERMKESLAAFRQDGFDQEKKAEAYSPSLRLGITGASVSGLLELVRYAYGGTFFEEHREDLEKIIFAGKEIEKEKVAFYKDKMALMGGAITKKMSTLCKNRNISVDVAPFLAQAIISAGKGRFYFLDPSECERYHYISESGAPMIGDIYLAHRPDDYIKEARNLARILGFPIFRQPPTVQEVHKAYKQFAESFPLYARFVQIEVKPLKERTFLGNAAKPILTQERFNESLRLGHSREIIQQTYRGWNNKPLDAWEAAHYGKPYEAQIDKSTNGDELSKDDLIDMIQEGYPLEEIHQAWPSYSIESLRAYKANVTRGTYGLGDEK